jgi:uncharacterized membrane protein YdjX (TVP38/TMEM64 family)
LPESIKRKVLFLLYTLTGCCLLSAGYIFRADLARALFQLEHVIGVLGPAAPFGMAIICGIWGALCLPGPLMQGTVGTLFASTPLVALAVVMAGETIAVTIAFTIGRTLGRERVRHKLEGKPWFVRLEDETRKKGFVGVLLFRSMPFFPNALASYAFGLTNLRFLVYLSASVLGSFPKMVLYIFGTTSVVNLFKAGTVSAATLAGSALVIVLLAVSGWALQSKLRSRRVQA